MSKDWTMRNYEPGDEERIVRYQNMEMKKESQKSIEHWRWEYASNPEDIKTICIAEDGEVLAGHYALMPLKMKVGYETLTGAQSVDTFTHHDYRRLGIFAALATRVYGIAADKGVSVLYGFPSMASYHGFVKKLDWIKVTSIDKMHRPLTLTSFIISSIHFMLKQGPKLVLSTAWKQLRNWPERREIECAASRAKIRRISRFDRSADELWSEIARHDEIRVVKDSAYLNWRYIEKPGNTYSVYKIESDEETKGFLVLGRNLIRGRFLKMCLAVDLVTKTTEEDIRLALHIASAIAKRLGGNSLAVWAPHDSFVSGLLNREGYLRAGGLILIARQNRRVFDSKVLRDIRRWFIMAGDTDVA